MAKVSDFTPSPEELQTQKLGGGKISETAFTQKPAAQTPKVTGGVTANVSSFTPSPEELAAQRYDTVGAKGTQPGMKSLSAAEKAALNPAKPPIEAPGLTPGVQPRSTLSLAQEPAVAFEMAPAKVGFEHIPQQSAGIFKPRPSSATPLGVPVGEPFSVSQSRALVPVPRQPTFTEKMASGANYVPPKVEPTMGERMGASANYVPPKVDPFTGQVIKESVPLGTRLAGIAKGFKGAAQKAIAPLAEMSPALNVVMAQQQNEAAMQQNVNRLATGKTETPVSSKSSIQQELALQAMRDPTFALKALAQASGAKTALDGFGADQPAEGAKPAEKPKTEAQPATTQSTGPTTLLPGGVVDQATPAPKTEAPRQIATNRPAAAETVSETPKAPSYSAEQVEAFSKGGTEQGVSKGKGGNFRYVQDDKGGIVKQNIDTGEVVPMKVGGVTSNILKPGEISPLAQEAKDRKENMFREALIRQAFQPIDGSTSLADVGTIKRNRLMAQQLLQQMDQGRIANQQAGLEEKKIAATERHASAAEEQNAIQNQLRAEREDRQAKAQEEATAAAKSAEARKASEKTYVIDGRPVKMTEDQYKNVKASKDRELFLRKRKDLDPEEAENEYGMAMDAKAQVTKALADPKNESKRNAILTEYRKATGLDYWD